MITDSTKTPVALNTPEPSEPAEEIVTSKKTPGGGAVYKANPIAPEIIQPTTKVKFLPKPNPPPPQIYMDDEKKVLGGAGIDMVGRFSNSPIIPTY